ncbi:MAG TPA: hypothetical protein VF682_19755, partial [Pseudomonas sp.]
RQPTAATDVLSAPMSSRINPVPRDDRIPPVGASLLAKALVLAMKICLNGTGLFASKLAPTMLVKRLSPYA